MNYDGVVDAFEYWSLCFSWLQGVVVVGCDHSLFEFHFHTGNNNNNNNNNGREFNLGLENLFLVNPRARRGVEGELGGLGGLVQSLVQRRAELSRQVWHWEEPPAPALLAALLQRGLQHFTAARRTCSNSTAAAGGFCQLLEDLYD